MSSTFIEQLPKAELHVHLEGTLEPELSFELAQKNKVELPYKTPEDFIAAYTFHDLATFLPLYYNGMKVLLHEEDFYRLTWDYLKRAREDEVLYAEMFFDPQAHTSRGVAFKDIITGIHKAQVDAAEKLGIESALIMCFLREMSAESASEHLAMALEYKDWIIGVGLDSLELGNPPAKFTEVFRLARSHGLKLTMHCDVNQDDTHKHIDQCLSLIEVDRIDHGVNCLELDELWKGVKARQLGLTVCPVSNEFVVQNLTTDAIKSMLDKDLLVTINSDDPAYFRAYINENFTRIFDEGEFTLDEMVTLAKNSFEASWLSPSKKASYIAGIETYAAKNALQ